MTTSSDDMQPVTRKELREELVAMEARLESKLEAKLEAKLETKLEAKLDEKLGAFEAKFDHKLAVFTGMLLDAIQQSEARLMRELGAHTRSSTEELTVRVAVLDEKYQDLPPRVARLEALTPAPKRRARKS